MSKKNIAHARPTESFWVRNKKSRGYLLKKEAGNKAYKFIRFLLLFGLCFMIVQPLLSKLSVSFMIEADLYDSTVISLPRHLTLQNYRDLANYPQLMHYWPALGNTFFISLVVSILFVSNGRIFTSYVGVIDQYWGWFIGMDSVFLTLTILFWRQLYQLNKQDKAE